MKLRIKGNSIRMRLTQTEVAQIKNGECVKEAVSFGGSTKLSYSVEASSSGKSIEARFEHQTVKILVPSSELFEWANSNQVAIKNNQPLEQGDTLFILIEKDFFCLKPRMNESEDESDLFENPNVAHGSCG